MSVLCQCYKIQQQQCNNNAHRDINNTNIMKVTECTEKRQRNYLRKEQLEYWFCVECVYTN